MARAGTSNGFLWYCDAYSTVMCVWCAAGELSLPKIASGSTSRGTVKMKPYYWRGTASGAAGHAPQRHALASFWAVADQPLKPPGAVI